MNHFNKLDVWQKSIDFAVDINQLTKRLPSHEKFNLQSQLNRAAVSIPSNIAEGAGRDSDRDFCRFLSIALGSAFEIETQLILVVRMNYFNAEELNPLFNKINEIQKMIYSLRKKKGNSYKASNLLFYLTFIGLLIIILTTSKF
jgi:four helix bundle protein